MTDTIFDGDRLPEWATDPNVPVPCDDLRNAFRALIHHAEGPTANRDGLIETPHRAAKAWRELTAGYHADPPDLKTFEADHDEIVVVAPIPFYSLCEHHLLPFHGSARIAYIPRDRILGLSKFARVTEYYARRLQVQERLTSQIAEHISDVLDPVAVGVIVRAEHLCMAMRGVEVPGAVTTTSVMVGAFRDDPAARQEALQLLTADG